MSGCFKPEVTEVTPAHFSGDARQSFILGLVPKQTCIEVSGTILLEQVVVEFPRHDPQLLAERLISELLNLQVSHGFKIRGSKTSLRDMFISRPLA